MKPSASTHAMRTMQRPDLSSEPLRILLIAYRFPPQGGGGVQRPAKLVKYWNRAGHAISVLTSSRSTVSLEDPTLLADVPPEVERVVVDDPSAYQRLRALRRRTGNPLLRRLITIPTFLVSQTAVPDLVSGWRLPAIRRGLELVASFRPDVIVVTGGPWTAFLVGSSLAEKTGLPLVLDYRDPWTHTYMRLKSGLAAALFNPRLERRVLRRADGVVAAHREILRRARSSTRPDVRMLWVPNGSDPEDFPHPPATPPADRFVLGYTGGFFRWRCPDALFRVIESLLREGRITAERFRFRMAGSVNPALERLASDSPVRKVLDVEGYLPHEESVRLLQSSTVTFVLEADQVGVNYHTPGKFYEVLYAGRPVLLLCPEGVTSRLARRLGGCWIAHPDDERAIRSVLLDMIERWEQGSPLPQVNRGHLRYYDRAHQADRFARFLGSLVGREPARLTNRADRESAPAPARAGRQTTR